MSAEERVVTVRDVLEYVRSHAVLLLAGAMLGALLAGIAAVIMHPVYRSTVVVMPATKQDAAGGLSKIAGSLGGLASLAGISLGAGGDNDEAMAVLKSREFAYGLIRVENMLPLFFARRWNATLGTWKSTDPRRIPTMADGFEFFDKRVRSIFEDKDRNLITIRVEWRDRDLAAKWANLMIRRANEQLRARKLAELDRSLQYLDDAAKHAESVELRQSIAKMMESQVNERMLTSSRVEYAFRVIDSATIADPDDFVSPKRALMIVIGAFVGLLLTLFGVMFRDYWRITSPVGAAQDSRRAA